MSQHKNEKIRWAYKSLMDARLKVAGSKPEDLSAVCEVILRLGETLERLIKAIEPATGIGGKTRLWEWNTIVIPPLDPRDTSRPP
jgi:hypothetical protein